MFIAFIEFRVCWTRSPFSFIDVCYRRSKWRLLFNILLRHYNLRIVLLLLTATVAGSLLLLLAVTGSSATIAGRLGAKCWRGWLRYLPAKWILGPWVPWFSCRLLRLRRLLPVGISLRLRSSIRTSGGLILVTLGLVPRKINGLTHCSDSNCGSC